MGTSRSTHFGVSEVVQSLLIRCISLLEILHHEEAVTLSWLAGSRQCTNKDVATQTAPDFPITLVEFQYGL